MFLEYSEHGVSIQEMSKINYIMNADNEFDVTGLFYERKQYELNYVL